MNKISLLSVSASLLLVAACSTSNSGTSTCARHSDDHCVPLTSVPPAVLAAAKKSVPGFLPFCAKLKHKHAGDLYEINGTSPKGKYEIDVTPTGRVLEIDRD
jgi:hypothetical protein